MNGNKQLVETRIKEELVNYLGNDEVASCSHAETTIVDINILCPWELTAQEELVQRIGGHSVGEMFPNIGTAQVAAQEYIEQIKKGEHKVHSNALLDKIKNNRLKAVWESSINLKDDKQISCQVNCGTCDGQGQIACGSCGGRGKETCSRCGGRGEVDCRNCHGMGTIYDYHKKIRVACSYCFYRGKERCSSCHGGYVDCRTCNGSGALVCRECSGTGRFTVIRTFMVKAVRKWSDIEFPPETADWIVSYIKEAADTKDNHLLPLDRTISIHPPGIKIDTDYPFELKAPGTLIATQATFPGTDEQKHHCVLLGEKLHPLNLGMIGDTASSLLAQQVLDNKADLEKLQPLLQQKIFGILLPLRNTDWSGIKNYPFQINLLSEKAGNNLLSAYSDVVNFYKTARQSNFSIKSWLQLSLIWIVVFFGLLVLINSTYIGQLDWSKSGYAAHYYWQDMWEKARIENIQGVNSFFFIATQSSEFFIRFFLCSLLGFCLAKMFFLVKRALTFLRFIGEIVTGICVGCVIFLLFQPAFLRVTAVTVTEFPPGLNELIAGGVMSLLLIPEVVTLGLFAGIFHSRRKMDDQVLREIEKINIPELEEDLGYPKQG